MSKKAASTKLRFERVPHTSELQLKIYGGSLAELFQNAAFAFAKSIKSELPQKLDAVREIEQEAPDEELLLADFLQEIVVAVDIYQEVYPEVDFIELRPDYLKAKLKGAEVGQFDQEIKGVTYHNLKVSEKDNSYEAEVVLDI